MGAIAFVFEIGLGLILAILAWGIWKEHKIWKK